MRAVQGVRVSSTVTKRNPRPRKYASASERQAAYRARAPEVCFRAEPQTADKLDQIAADLDVSRADLLLSMTKFALTNHDWARFGLTHRPPPFEYGIETRKANPMKKPTPAQLAARARFAEMARSGAFKRKAKRKKNPDIYSGVLRASEKAASSAKDGVVKIGDDVYNLKFNQREYVYNVTDQDGNYVLNINTKSINEAKRFLKQYLQNPSPRKKTVSQKISQLMHEGYPQKQAVAVALSEQRRGKVKRNPATGRKGSHTKLNPVKYRDIAKGVAPARVAYAVHMPDRPSFHAMAYFTKKADALEAAQEVSDRTGKPVAVSRVQVHFGPM